MAKLDPIVEAKAAIEAQPGAVGTPLASSRGVMLYKVMGKIFAILEDARVKCVILKCDPHVAEALRERYASVGHRSHLDRRYWIAVGLGADVPGDEIERLIAHSHAQVVAGLTRKQRDELRGVGTSEAEACRSRFGGLRRHMAKRADDGSPDP